jgi:hypothetical protein
LLTHVPDVARLVLGVPVDGVFNELALGSRGVANDPAVMPLANFFVSVVATTTMSCGGLPSSTLR